MWRQKPQQYLSLSGGQPSEVGEAQVEDDGEKKSISGVNSGSADPSSIDPLLDHNSE